MANRKEASRLRKAAVKRIYRMKHERNSFAGSSEVQQNVQRHQVTFEFGQGGGLVGRFMGPKGLLAVGDVAKWFGMSRGQLAQTIGVKPETLQRARRAIAPKTQGRVKEMLEIVGRVTAWAGGKDQALAWYRAEPIPAFGGRTAEFLVKEGKAAAVREYLDFVALGGFA